MSEQTFDQRLADIEARIKEASKLTGSCIRDFTQLVDEPKAKGVLKEYDEDGDEVVLTKEQSELYWKLHRLAEDLGGVIGDPNDLGYGEDGFWIPSTC